MTFDFERTPIRTRGYDYPELRAEDMHRAMVVLQRAVVGPLKRFGEAVHNASLSIQSFGRALESTLAKIPKRK